MASYMDNDDVSTSPEDITKAFELIPKLLDQRQKELDRQENMIRKERKALEEERKLYGATKGNSYDVIHLNVGGVRMDVLRLTLTSVGNSVLASQFSGRWDDSLVKDRDGNFFIDQPVEIFAPLVNFLRSTLCESPGGQTDPQPPPSLETTFGKDKEKYTHFLRMTEYYGMTHGVYPFHIRQIAPPQEELDEEEIIPERYFPGCEVVARHFRCLYLNRFQHNGRVESFDVRLGLGVTSFQVGWIDPNLVRNDTSTPRLSKLSDAVCIDAKTSTTHVGTSFSGPLDDERTVGIEDGTIIRCTRFNYSFELNHDGREILPTNYSQAPNRDSPADHRVPAMCGSGTWQITKIIFDP